MKLHIANKNYSSWSFRPWIAMRVAQVPFEEALTPFDDEARNPAFRAFSPTAKVPVLTDGELTLWESLAIVEYVAECFPEKGLWPDDSTDRALARAYAAEMHAGFSALRNACPMNMRRTVAPLAVDEAVRTDIRRIEAIWTQCLERSGGPFLFGTFSNVDAMYAPVVSRLTTYALSQDRNAAVYSESIRALPAWREWENAARAEKWIVPADEV